MALQNRTEGQLWIDKNPPYGLKYHTHGNTYQLEATAVFKAKNTTKAGTLVAIDSIDGNGAFTFKAAQFPRDIDSILGICPKNVTSGEETSILRDGVIELTDLSMFYQEKDTLNGDYHNAPVYWFIGRSFKNGNSYGYVDPSEKIGYITLGTPSGMRWGNEISCDDPSLNVGYSNLPTIGTVLDYTKNNNKLTTLKISLAISDFESSLEWNWPYYSKVGNAPSDTFQGNRVIAVRHGLFPKFMSAGNENFYNFRPRCFCDATVLQSTSDDTEHRAFVGVDNYYGLIEGESADDDKRTEIIIKSNLTSDKRINVSGKVVYTFVKQFN